MSDEARTAARAAWERSAPAWGKYRAVHGASVAPVSAWMVEAIAPQPGHVVLEVAAGAGDTGFLAAELIRPGGRLISTDGAEAMVEVARARAAELGLDNVEFKAMEAEWLDLPAASVDGVLCRFGYMLLVDPEAGLRDARRVLRPGGRIALAVWDVPEANPCMGAIPAALRVLPSWSPPPPGAPGAFRLADRDALRELLEDTGFTEIVVEAVAIEERHASPDALFDLMRDLSGTLRTALADISPADHTRVRDAFDAHLAPYVQPGGELVAPGSVLCAAASA